MFDYSIARNLKKDDKFKPQIKTTCEQYYPSFKGWSLLSEGFSLWAVLDSFSKMALKIVILC